MFKKALEWFIIIVSRIIGDKHMKLKKILMYLIVALLVIGVGIAFVVIFNFDNPQEEVVPEITEDEVFKLYNSIPENPMGYGATYPAYYTQYNNLSNTVVLSAIYEYILDYDASKLTSITTADLPSNIVNNTNYGKITPLYKVSTSTFEEFFPKLFGKDKLDKMKIEDFRYDYQTLAEIVDGYYYIFMADPLETNTNDIVFHDMTKYLVTENNKTIEIYDYYLKCDLNTNNCYNDERKTELNSQVKYNPNFNINNYIDNLVIYKHTFNYEDGYYYWYSSSQDN